MASLRFYSHWIELRKDYPQQASGGTIIDDLRSHSWQSSPDNGILTGFETEDPKFIYQVFSTDKVAQMSFYQQILYKNALEISKTPTSLERVEHHEGQLCGVSCHIRDLLQTETKKQPSEP
jgi:hypothetical protein